MTTPESHLGVTKETENDSGPRVDFLRAIVDEDLRTGRAREIVTRFPPEPNGFLHIGHAKAVALSFGVAAEHGGRCHLRFDDTNPETEDQRYVESIMDSVRWLGYDWGEHLYFASDYFGLMYEFAEYLIREGEAYVDSQDEEAIRESRGTVTEPGRPGPYRDRSPEESLDLFRRMRAGEFPNGAHVLRGRIDLGSPNMLMRDPLLYRIRHAHHYRTGDEWCIYPLYDYAHAIEDAIEGVTHSFCTLEFENNRAMYDWIVDRWQGFMRSRGEEPARPRQYEFARGNVEYTIVSKRKLLELVRGAYVSGWDDPRMPTIAGLRRRGVTPEAIRGFWDRAGVARAGNRVDIGKLEYAIRDDLNQTAPRVLCVLDPLKVVLTNYPADRVEELDAPYFPHDVPREGSRKLPFSRELYIDRKDFMENPPKGFYRLSPGAEVRLRYGYVIRCQEVVRGADGEIVQLHCTYDPETRGGTTPDGRTVRGTIQWVSASRALPCEVRLYDRLFTVPDPEAGDGDFKDHLNPESLVVADGALIEPSVADDPPGTRYQFERLGYFCSDSVDSRPGALVFNRTVTLRDTWARASAPAPAPQSKAARRGTAAVTEGRVDRAGSEGEAVVAATEPAGAHLEEYVGGGTPRVRAPDGEARAIRYERELGLPVDDAELLVRDGGTAELFDGALAAGAPPRAAANWIIHEIFREAKGRDLATLPFDGAGLAELLRLVDEGVLSSSAAREVLAEMVESGGAPLEIVERRGLRQVSDIGALEPVVERVVGANAPKVEAYRAGKTGLLGFFIGQVMRETGGKANPEMVRELVEARIAEGA